jgi:hypothetical protein
MVRLEGLRKFRKFNDIVTRTRDLPACSIAPQLSTLKGSPNFAYKCLSSFFLYIPNPIVRWRRETNVCSMRAFTAYIWCTEHKEPENTNVGMRMIALNTMTLHIQQHAINCNCRNSGHYSSFCLLFKKTGWKMFVPHRKHMTSLLRAQQVKVIYRFVTMVY